MKQAGRRTLRYAERGTWYDMFGLSRTYRSLLTSMSKAEDEPRLT